MSWWDDFKRSLSGEDPNWDREDTHFRERYTASGLGQASDYDRSRPAYQFGYSAGRDEEYVGRQFSDVETDLRSRWDEDLTTRAGSWDTMRSHISDAYQRGQETRVTRAEEELALGTREVEAGAVNVRKSVETEHVTQSVPLTREEVTIERRPVSDAYAATDLAADEIRIPVTEEEVVVEKRPVVKEEIVLRKVATTENEQVEADVRKERVDIEDTTRTRGFTDDPGNPGLR